MYNHRTYLVVFLLAGFTTWLLVPPTIRLAWKIGAVDQPGVRKLHRNPVPLLGGLAIALGMWLPITLLLLYENRITHLLQLSLYSLIAVFLAGTAMLGVGIADDTHGLSPRQKLTAQVPVAIALVALGVRITNLTIPGFGTIELESWGYLLSFLWLLGVTNAVNLVDGLDGLATGVSLFAALTNAVVAVLNDNVLEAVMMCSLAGACLGFLPYNFSPAKIFLGDTGSLFLGMTLAVSSIVGAHKGIVGTSLLIPLFVMGYPIADTLLAMARRMYRGRSPFSGDASHIHHRLLAKGLNHRQAAMTIYVACALCGLLALSTLVQNGATMALMLLLLLALAIVGMDRLGYFTLFASPSLERDRLTFKAMNAFATMMQAKLRLATTPEDVVVLLGQIATELSDVGYSIEPAPTSRFGTAASHWRRSTTPPERKTEAAPPSEYEISFELPSAQLTLRCQYSSEKAWDEFRVERGNLLTKLANLANTRLQELLPHDPPAGVSSSGSPA